MGYSKSPGALGGSCHLASNNSQDVPSATKHIRREVMRFVALGTSCGYCFCFYAIGNFGSAWIDANKYFWLH